MYIYIYVYIYIYTDIYIINIIVFFEYTFNRLVGLLRGRVLDALHSMTWRKVDWTCRPSATS